MIYQMDIIVKSMIDKTSSILSVCLVEGPEYFFPLTVSEQISLHMNIKITLPIKEHSWCP
jgi:hypothetical protein